MKKDYNIKVFLKYISLQILFFAFAGNIYATDYYSNDGGNFTITTIWGENTDGTGTHPLSSAFQDGANTFTILDNDNIIVNDSINIAGLTVGGGTSGKLIFGDDDTARWLIVQGTLTVKSGAEINVSSNNATHNMQIEGAISNSGTINLRNNSSQVVNTILVGSFSITGNTPKFNNLTIQSGTITAGVALDIDGTVTIETGATFADGGFTHTVSGNWTENGSGKMTGTGTIEMDATLVQSITTAATFNNLKFINGGIVSIGGNITVNGNFEIDATTKATTSTRNHYKGDFTINTGGVYEATADITYFDGVDAQTITVTDDCDFNSVYFQNTDDDDDLKTIVGNMTMGRMLLYKKADVKSTGTLVFKNGFDLRGVADFSGTVYLKGGTFFNDYNDGTDTDNTFSLGTAEVIVIGNVSIEAGDIMVVDNDFTVETGYMVINNNSELKGTGDDDDLILKESTTLYVRGSDNFPTGFANYTLDKLSGVRYDANIDQTIRGGITYGRIHCAYKNKTVDGGLDINDYLYLSGTCSLDLGNYNHSLAGYLSNSGGSSSITTSGGTFTLDGADNNQYIQKGASYVFNNFVITNSSPTAVRTKSILGDITLTGDFTVTNSGSSTNYLILDIRDNDIIGGASKTFTVGANVKLYNSGADNFSKIDNDFVLSINENSTIRFYGATQEIPALTYGVIELYANGNKNVQGNIVIKKDIRRIGYTPVFVDNGYNVDIYGDWVLAIAYTNMTGLTTFKGADQTVSASKFGNVFFSGTDTKTIDGTLDIIGDLTIDNGVTVNSNNMSISLGGNWNNSGTGAFSQKNARTTFDGVNINQTITANISNVFGDIYINKTGTNRDVITNKDLYVERNFIFTKNNGNFNLNGKTLYIGGDWYLYTGCVFTHNNGKIVFNGSSEDQLIRNYNASTEYYDLEFVNSGVKRLYEKNFDVNGDFFINGATLYGGNHIIYISGNWINTGIFQSTTSVVFDGADQTIGSSSFHDLDIAGTDTKTLDGNISCSGWLKIEENSKLDVSTNNYEISVEEHWYNNQGDGSGYFECREGTVNLIGGTSNIETGGIVAGKYFYNLNINNSSSYTRLYPTSSNNLKVLNDLTLNSESSSYFYTYYNDVYIGGSLVNNGAYYYQNSNTTPNKIIFDGTSGTHNIDFGDLYILQDTILINGGATYQLTGDLSFSKGGNLRIENGKFDLNHQVLEMYTGNVIIESAGTLEVDSAAVLKVEENQHFFNKGGVFELVGTEGSPATLTSRRNSFEYIQTGATSKIHAKYYLINSTNGNGIDIQEGGIDATNNFSNGTFTGGSGTVYLKTNDIDLGAGITCTEVSFNTGPTNNVQRTSGSTGKITFSNSAGTFSGEAHEDDAGSLIDWTYPGRITWDHGAATDNWNDAANWVGDVVPTSSDNVYLDNSVVAGSYTVKISATGNTINRLDIAGSSAITLTLDGGDLSILDNLTINSGNILEQNNSADTLRIGGNLSNGGTYKSNSVGIVKFNPQGGYHTINSASSFYDVIIACDTNSTSLVLGRNMDVDNDISILVGTLSASNKTITVGGNWEVNGGVFDGGTGKVTFDKTGGTQTISGGVFYDFTATNESEKRIIKNIEIQRYFDIRNKAVVDGDENYIYIGGRFNNYVGKDGFSQTGTGTVIFNGTGSCYLQNAAHDSTIFNNLIFQGTGTKYVYDTIVVEGNLINQTGSNTYLYEDSYIVGDGADNDFTMTGGTLYVRGENNFPKDFETISITGGYVDYYSDTDQFVYPTTYYNLRLRAIHANTTDNRNTKTVLDDLVVTNQCQVYDSLTTLDMNNHTLTIGGNLDFRYVETPQINWGTGGVVFNGGNVGIDRYIHIFNNFTKTGTGTVTLYDTIQVNGDMLFDTDTRFNMQGYKVECKSSNKTFTLKDGVYLYTSVLSDNNPLTDNPGLPTGFTNYSLDKTSYVYYRGNGKQTIYTKGGAIDYGNLYIYTNTTDTLSLDGDLDVDGDFRMYYTNPVLIDSGYNMNLSGSFIDLRNYHPTNTITFDGETQSIVNYAGSDTLKFNNLVLSGSTGQKTFSETVTRVKGDLTIGANDTMYVVYDMEFSGATFTNNGYFRHIRNIVTINGDAQTIDPGAKNDFYGIVFNNGNKKTFINHGINIGNGVFKIDEGTEVDLGALTHTLASTTFEMSTGVDTLLAENAVVNFDRNGTQYIPKIKAKELIFSTGGWKILTDTIWTDDLSIKGGSYFRPGDVSPNAFPMYIYGNWNNEGYFRAHEGTVFFESNNTTSKTIKSGGYLFYNVAFNQEKTSSREYTLLDNTTFSEDLTIGNGATLKLNGKDLTIGNDDSGSPEGEQVTIQSGGILNVDAGANLLLNCQDDTASVVVQSGGVLTVVGAEGDHATVLRGNNRYAYNITIESGATIKAKYYHFKNLADSGLYVMSGATIDPSNNFSYGIWSDMYTRTNHGTQRYLYIDNDVSGIGDIEDVTFNHGTTPTEGVHYNVKRGSNAVGSISFKGTISGLLGGETYEDEGSGSSVNPGNITWPPVTTIIWTGATNTDWFTATNWSPATVPDLTKNAVIPMKTNNPIINTSDTAKCKSLNITDGILVVESGILNINTDVTLGSSSILGVDDASCSIVVGRNWNSASDANFIHGDDTVKFISTTTTAFITPRNTVFKNVVFDGTSTFFIEGASIDIDGSMEIKNGTVYPNTVGYKITIAGDYNNIAGEFSTETRGYVEFDGANQSITNGEFSQVIISGTGTKTTSGNFKCLYNNTSTNKIYSALLINSTLKAGVGSSFDIDGSVYIESTGGINDGDGVHYFAGRYWTGSGSYVGSGIFEFDGGSQTINESKFNTIILNNQTTETHNWKYLGGDVDLTGDLIVSCYGFNCYDYQVTNTDGTGDFIMSQMDSPYNRIYISGANNYPTGFSSYVADKMSMQYYNGTVDQVIKGKSNSSEPVVQYGYLELNSGTTKTLGGDIDVNGRIYLYNTDVTLDVSANNYKINLAGNWYNHYTGNFICRQGEVVLDGSNSWPGTNQWIYLGTTGVNDFYKLTINSTSDYTRIYNTDITVKNNLNVIEGNLYLYNNYTVTVEGDMTASGNGVFYPSGTYKLVKSSGTANIQMNGSTLNNLTIDAGATYILLDDISINGTFDFVSGVFNGNGKVFNMGNSVDAAKISGTYKIGEGGYLKIGNSCNFNVLSGGVIEIIGTEGDVATVTNQGGTNRYNFSVESGATIKAENYLFEYMSSEGIYLKDGSIIDNTYHFSNGTFTNPASGGACLRVENTQSFIDADRIDNVSFPNNPGGGTYNVIKTSTTVGTLEFYNSTGNLSGELYDNDPGDLINWTGPVTLTWTGDYDDNWFDKRNWSANIGASKIPTSTDDVIIVEALNSPEIAQDSAVAKNVTIQNSAFLTIKTPTGDSDTALVVKGNFINEGTFTMTNITDTIVVEANWEKNSSAIFNAGNGTVVMKTITGIKSLKNGDAHFYNLTVDATGTLDIGDDTYVDNDFNILSGIVDMSESNNDLYIGGDFINSGTFEPQGGKVIFNSSLTRTKNINNSIFYNVDFDTKSTYNLLSTTQINSDLNVLDGVLSLNGNVLKIGDNSGIDELTVDGGIFDIDELAILKIGTDASINVNNGGTIQIVGVDEDNVATVTSQNDNNYSFVVNSGGNISAKYYSVSHINATGLWLKSGAVVDGTNNLSNGTFSNGESNGRYLLFENDLVVNDTIRDVIFNSSVDVNVKRVSGANPAIFKDAFGLRGGYYYEEDEESPGNPTTGLVRWNYSDPMLTWTGNDHANNVRWDNLNNWEDAAGTGGVPNDKTLVIIPDVDYDPVLDAGTDNEAKNVTIQVGGKLTIGGGMNLIIKENLEGEGTLTVTNGSISTIEVGNNWDNLGVFNNGGSSTVKFVKASGAIDINPGGNSFYNLEFSSTGTATFRTASSFDIDGGLKISANTTFEVTSSSHTVNIAGDYLNSGTFNTGGATITFDGSSAQSLTSSAEEEFTDLVLSGNSTKTLNCNIKINNDLTISSGSTLDGGANTITIKGDWVNNGAFTASTSDVVFKGTSTQNIEKSGAETFYNLTVNNTSIGTAIKLSTEVNVSNKINLIDGIVETGSSSILNVLSGVTVNDGTVANAGSNISYINGPMTKTGSSDFVFPIGKGSVFARLEISGMSTSSKFYLEYFETASPNLSNSMAVPLNKLSDVEYWDLQRKSGTEEPIVTLFWEDETRSKTEKNEDVVVACYDGANWNSLHGNPATDNGDGSGYCTATDKLTAFNHVVLGFEYPTYTWDGSSSTSWNDAANWDKNEVPNNEVNVVIPDVSSINTPEISSVDAEVYNLKIQNNGILKITNDKDISVNGEFIIDAGGVFDIESTSSSNINVLHTWINNGTFNTGDNSLVVYNKSNDQDINLSEFYNLKIAGTGNKTLQQDIVVKNNILIEGTLVAGSHKISLAGNWSNTGSFEKGTGTVELNGVNQQTITKGGTGETFYNLIINNTNITSPQVKLGGNVTVSSSFELKDGNVESTSSHLLTLESGATVPGASYTDASYVIGPMKKYGKSDFTFPIGKDGIYARLGLTSITSSSSAAFTAEFINDKYATRDRDEAVLKKVSAIEYWNIERENTPSAKVTLYYEDTARSKIDKAADLLVAHFNGTEWEGAGNSANSGDANKYGWVTSDLINSFSPFTFGSSTTSSNPLPISLLYFVVNQVVHNVDLYWETASELNSSYFIIERSLNTKKIEQIGIIEATGNSSENVIYNFIDENPIRGISYYRLVQVDNDGARHEYDWKSVVYEDNNINYNKLFSLDIYPNPAFQTEMQIELKSESIGEFKVDIFDMTGNHIYNKNIFIKNKNQLYILKLDELSTLQEGIYLVNISGNNYTKQMKFVIK